MGLESFCYRVALLLLMFAPCVGLERELLKTNKPGQMFAPCVGLEREWQRDARSKGMFAPCVGLESCYI